MAKGTRRWRWAGLGGMASLVIWGSASSPLHAAPTVAQMLNFTPRQLGVDCSTPTAQQQSACKVELVKGASKGSGWVLKDSSGTLRRFFDSNDDNKIDIWSYYKDGVEVYREIDSNGNGKPDQYRWLNAGGMKWGVDENEDGRIDSWKMISPEEVSQEVLLAINARDYARLQALMMTEAEIAALDLPAAEAKRLRDGLSGARKKFDETLEKLKGANKLTWLHMETGVPHCVPAGEGGSRVDRYVHPRGTILYESGGKNDWMQTGEMIQVGQAWRLVEAPYLGAAADKVPAAPGTNLGDNPKLQKLIEELTELDKKPPMPQATPGPSPEVVQYNLRRADLLEKIVGEVKPKDREQWIRQVADSLSTAAQNSPVTDRTALDRLVRLEKQIVEAMAGSSLAAYVTFREMQADYAMRLLKPGEDFNRVQKEWIDRLTEFVTKYPKADDGADALLQLGMVSEFLAKEIEAKKWYEQLARDYPDKPQAVKATGAKKRLELEGKPLELSGPLLDGGQFSMTRIAGKVAVVYYWASWNQQCVGDFAKLKLLLDTYGPKGFEVVCVSLDGTAEEAASFLKRVQAPGVHLHQPGGLESKLATDYGVMVLPNLFLVGKDGKVVSRTIQINGLEDELKKQLK